MVRMAQDNPYFWKEEDRVANILAGFMFKGYKEPYYYTAYLPYS